MLCCLLSYVERRGALLVMPSQSVLLLIRQSVTQGNCSISVFNHSFSKVKWWENIVTIETEIKWWNYVRKLYKVRKEFCHFLWIMKPHEDHPKNGNTWYSASVQQYSDSVCSFQHLTGWTSLKIASEVFPGKKPVYIELFFTLYWTALPAWLVLLPFQYLYTWNYFSNR